MLSPIEGVGLTELPGIRHGFFNRVGGVSKGIYAGLNAGLNSNDRREDVAENRRRIASHFGLGSDHLVSPKQVHGIQVATLSGPWPDGRLADADAIVTATPGIAIGVATADCAPVLFADPRAGVVAAAHAGWRGALEGVLPATLAAMERLGADPADVTVVIGPTISQDRYEVGADFRARFLAVDPVFDRFFAAGARPNHFQFDLPGFILSRLRAIGIGSVADLSLCTYDDEDWFYSYRRATHRNEADYGRQISAIALA
jgi:YfiH family protein